MGTCRRCRTDQGSAAADQIVDHDTERISHLTCKQIARYAIRAAMLLDECLLLASAKLFPELAAIDQLAFHHLSLGRRR